MRQESGYDPTVVSGSDAIGLLQLLPGVAQGLARELGDPVPTRDDLMRPEVNIHLAAAYVAALLAAFGGQAPFAIAGYNAGGGRIRHWLQTAPAGEQLDHFVERIPIDQTRNYVRRVTTHLIRYRWLLAPGDWPSVPEVSLTIDRTHITGTERIPPPAPVPGDDSP
jgi:soluble lytic murein transglycosylase